MLCRQFDRTTPGLTADTPQGRGGGERAHRVSIPEVGSPRSPVELDG